MEDSKLKILIVSQYFWPENMRINDLVEGFIKKGHEVTVLTGVPNYPEGRKFAEYKKNKRNFLTYKGAKIFRAPICVRGNTKINLVLNYLSFFINASFFGLYKLRNEKFDSIFVYAVSPIMAAIPAIVLGKRTKSPIFVWVLDLWPETLSAVNVIKNKYILGIVGKVVSWIYNRCDYLLLQSKSFTTNVLKYCTKPIEQERIIYFPSWAEDIFSNVQTTKENSFLAIRDNNFFTIMFAGNIGEAQDFPSILDAFDKLKSYSIQLVIIGDGKMCSWVQEQIKLRQLDNVRILGKYPIEAMPEAFSCANALLVSLKSNEVFSKTIPGKLQVYLALGKPIIGMIDGEAAQVIKESGSGFVSAAGDADKLCNNIITLYNMDKNQREEMGQLGKKYYQKFFDSTELFNTLENLFRTATLRKNS